ncbi:MAG: HAD-IA family hydrolase [Acidimicrobiales bacterium]|nr:HAD-IA family hydrolase [Acidimicrobiales bacterium]
MTLAAIVFGSLGTITETSELHRAAFNQAFEHHGLEWRWSKETYASLLKVIGGRQRILEFAQQQGQNDVSPDRATEIHEWKTDRYAGLVAESDNLLRSGVVRLVAEAKEAGLLVGFATGTSLKNITSNLDAVPEDISLDDFDGYTVRGDLDEVKPAPDAHLLCMTRLGVRPSETIAIEDTADGVASASVAGALVVATPGDYAVGQDFSSAAVVLSGLGDPDRPALVVGRGPALPAGMVTIDWLRDLLAARRH